MNKEENIQKIQDQIDKVKEYLEYGMPYSEYLDLQLAFDEIVNLIQKQEKIIDELKNHIYYKNCIACGKEFKAKRKDAKYCAYCSRSIANRAYYLSLTEKQKQKRREQAKLCMRRIRAERKKVENG